MSKHNPYSHVVMARDGLRPKPIPLLVRLGVATWICLGALFTIYAMVGN